MASAIAACAPGRLSGGPLASSMRYGRGLGNPPLCGGSRGTSVVMVRRAPRQVVVVVVSGGVGGDGAAGGCAGKFTPGTCPDLACACICALAGSAAPLTFASRPLLLHHCCGGSGRCCNMLTGIPWVRVHSTCLGSRTLYGVSENISVAPCCSPKMAKSAVPLSRSEEQESDVQ